MSVILLCAARQALCSQASWLLGGSEGSPQAAGVSNADRDSGGIEPGGHASAGAAIRQRAGPGLQLGHMLCCEERCLAVSSKRLADASLPACYCRGRKTTLASDFWSPGLCWSSATGSKSCVCLPKHELAAFNEWWRGPEQSAQAVFMSQC